MTSLQGYWRLFKRLISMEKANHRDLHDNTDDRTLQYKNVQKDVKSPLIKEKTEKAHIQVGLDFGTSSTKIVYSQIGKRYFRVINFNHDLPNYPQYCLPSLAAINNNGELLLGIPAARQLLDKEWDSGLNRFKVIVAGKYDTKFREPITEEKFHDYLRRNNYDGIFTAERITTIYVAHAMHLAREIIQGYPEYKNIELDISFNICMPIDHIENNNAKPVFERIFSHAETIERKWCQQNEDFDLIKASFDLDDRLTIDVSERRVFAVPEAVASFASYLISLRRQGGLHAIIDLGAGTTDVSICNLAISTGETISFWYSARNIPKGTINVERIIAFYMMDSKTSSQCTCSDLFSCLCLSLIHI